MKRKLTVTYVIQKEIEVDVDDYVLTEDEINRIAKFEANQTDFPDCKNVYWEWDNDPKAIAEVANEDS